MRTAYEVRLAADPVSVLQWLLNREPQDSSNACACTQHKHGKLSAYASLRICPRRRVEGFVLEQLTTGGMQVLQLETEHDD